jgi:hypothetical protein
VARGGFVVFKQLCSVGVGGVVVVGVWGGFEGLFCGVLDVGVGGFRVRQFF